MVQIDYRLGGKPRYFIGLKPGELMQVPPEVKRSVTFVCCKTSKGKKVAGTAFFVSMPFEDMPDRDFVYLVTAKHVIESIKEHSLDELVHIRLNLKEGGYDFMGISFDTWYYHPNDSSIDVAVMPLPRVVAKDIDFLTIPLDEMVATDEIIAEKGIDIGDEVFLVGLFFKHYGSQRNIPILRVGNIAQMPEEPVQTKLGPMKAYLIEARSLGGISGSPVFVHRGDIRTRQGQPQLVYEFYLLGLMHGHWDLPAPDIDMLIQDELDREPVNMGIAVVVPVSDILSTLNHEELMEQRERIERERKEQEAPTLDDATKGLTEEEFREALEKVSRPEEAPPDEGTSET